MYRFPAFLAPANMQIGNCRSRRLARDKHLAPPLEGLLSTSHIAGWQIPSGCVTRVTRAFAILGLVGVSQRPLGSKYPGLDRARPCGGRNRLELVISVVIIRYKSLAAIRYKSYTPTNSRRRQPVTEICRSMAVAVLMVDEVLAWQLLTTMTE